MSSRQVVKVEHKVSVAVFTSRDEKLVGEFKNVRMSCRKHNCSARSVSAVYVNLTDCVYQNTCQKGYFNITVCVCVCIRPLRRCLKHVSLSLSLCVCVHARASMCAAECRKRSVSPETRANDKLSLYGGYTY